MQYQVVAIEPVDADLRKRRNQITHRCGARWLVCQASSPPIDSQMATHRPIQFAAFQLHTALT
jgi:hypothetical protein